MKRIARIAFAAIILFVASPVFAQGEPPIVIHSTKPISPELTAALDAWLAVDPPSDAPYYIVTYSKTRPNGETQVSLAGVQLDAPELPEDWSLFENMDSVVWIGSVTVEEDGSVFPFTPAQARAAGKLALPVVPAGGGSYVAFPFSSGTGMIYGPRGVHGAGDYGTSGMVAVDLVSGDDLGADAAPPYAYASDDGTIDYICDDGTTVAVRTHNTSTGDYFIYAHLLDNAGLAIDEEFTRGQQLGSIKYGNFDDDCGWAAQQEDHYHIHWMFTPSGGSFQAEGCILSTSSQKWTCGNDTIGTGGWLYGGGGYGSGLDDLTGKAGGTPEPSFWDGVVVAFISIFDRGLLKLLPSHNPFGFLYALLATVRLVLRVVYVLAYGNLNVGPFFAAMLWGLAVNSIMSVIWFASFLLKAWKSLVPILGA